MPKTVYVITYTDMYEETWVERIYSTLDKAKEYLMMNWKFWVKDCPDVTEEEYEEGVRSIQEITNDKLEEDCFYMTLEDRGGELSLEMVRLDEEPAII